jgi:spore germination protein YaaH
MLCTMLCTCCGRSDGIIHQRWFDDPDSLRLKYAAAKELGLRGVGPFCYGDIWYDTPSHKAHAEAMWDALHAFTQ